MAFFLWLEIVLNTDLPNVAWIWDDSRLIYVTKECREHVIIMIELS